MTFQLHGVLRTAAASAVLALAATAAHAVDYQFTQNYNTSTIQGTVTVTFSASLLGGYINNATITPLTLTFTGSYDHDGNNLTPLQALSLSYPAANIDINQDINLTSWYPADNDFDDPGNGFSLIGNFYAPVNVSLMWVGGPLNSYASGGDPNASAIHGALSFFDTSSNLIATADSNGTINAGTVAAIPEPSTYLMMAGGLLALAAVARRRKQ